MTTPIRRNDQQLLGWHPLKFSARLVSTGDPAATIDRLFQSKHVGDLRWIVVLAQIGLAIIFLVVGIPAAYEIVQQLHTAKQDWQTIFATLKGAFTILGPALAAFAAICAWAYRAGSARLGVVDLFACEIGTLCRVATVLDAVHRLIERFERGAPTGYGTKPVTRPFVSEEDYFPIFNSNSKDLQSLEARVVINITAFYTYMKAVRDSMRVLATIPAQKADLGPTSEHGALGPWHQSARDAIYLWFLGLESGRLAIADLVEFEPEQAERVIVVLLSELDAYHFLCDQFSDRRDIRYGRIRLRATDYQKLVPQLCRLVETKLGEERSSGAPSDWLPAHILLPELQHRYRMACEATSVGDSLSVVPNVNADAFATAGHHTKMLESVPRIS
jgi:hypothetical protein